VIKINLDFDESQHAALLFFISIGAKWHPREIGWGAWFYFLTQIKIIMGKAREKNVWALQQEMMEQWLSLSKGMYQPLSLEKGAGNWNQWVQWMESFMPRTGLESKSMDIRFFMKAYGDWLSSMYRFWKSGSEMFNNNAWGKEWGNHFFSPSIFRDWLDTYLKFVPNDSWKNMLGSYQKGLDQNIQLLNEVDLPFDEMAASLERLVARYLPLDPLGDEQAFSLGNNLHKYLEVLINPFFAISGTPRLIEWFRHWRIAQIYYMSFLLKSAELRGKVLESSLAVFLETFKALLEEFESKGVKGEEQDFYTLLVTKMEEHLEKLLRSDEYIHIQMELSEIGLALKSRMDALGELSFSGLPVMTRSDEDDIAREIETMRVKIRKLENAMKQQRKTEKTTAFSES
jgi:hypothetical protein